SYTVASEIIVIILLFTFFDLSATLLLLLLILSGAMNVLILECCVLCLCTRESVEIMLQFQIMGVVSDSKMNLVGALGRSFFEFLNSFQKRWEKPKKKIKEKREFLRKTS
ncbi:Uncharacterized protein FWK35_00036421, partial [Aphis craccivora]